MLSGNLDISNSWIKKEMDEKNRRSRRAVSAKEDEAPGANSPGAECTVAIPGFPRDKSNTVFFTRGTADRGVADTARISHSFAIAPYSHQLTTYRTDKLSGVLVWAEDRRKRDRREGGRPLKKNNLN